MNKKTLHMLVIDERPPLGFFLVIALILVTTLTLTLFAMS